MSSIYKLFDSNHSYIKDAVKREELANHTGFAECHSYKCHLYKGRLHRLDGPAREYIDGAKSWWINGTRIKCETNEQFKLLIDIMKLKGLL